MEKTFSSRRISGRFFGYIRHRLINKTENISFHSYGKRYFFAAIIFGLSVVAFSSCKDPDELGLEVLPNSDQVFVISTDTTTLLTVTTREDSLSSKGVSLQLLGSYTDPVFGRSDAGFYSQIRLGLTPTLSHDTFALIPDSLILSLAYAGYYGDTNTTQTLHVYRMDDGIQADSGYYTSKSFALYNPPDDLANGFSFVPKPKTPFGDSTGTQPAQLRIPLSLALADSLLSFNGRPQYADNPTWVQYFKGLYIKTDT